MFSTMVCSVPKGMGYCILSTMVVHVYVRTMIPLVWRACVRAPLVWRYHGTMIPLEYTTCVHERVRTYVLYVRTYTCTHTVMSQLYDWKRAHMCTENQVCFGSTRVRTIRYEYVHVYCHTRYCNIAILCSIPGRYQTSKWYHVGTRVRTYVRTLTRHGP
jgi:hypothetical protein